MNDQILRNTTGKSKIRWVQHREKGKIGKVTKNRHIYQTSRLTSHNGWPSGNYHVCGAAFTDAYAHEYIKTIKDKKQLLETFAKSMKY
jgi:hypothetical protein